MRVPITESDVKVPQYRGNLEGKGHSYSSHSTEYDACPGVAIAIGVDVWFQSFIYSYKKASSHKPHRTDEGSDRKEHVLSKFISLWAEGAALEPRFTSSRFVIISSAVLPKPSAKWVPDRENQYSCYLYSYCIKCYIQRNLFLFLKSAQLICVTVGTAAWHLLHWAYIRKEAFSWSLVFSLLIGFRKRDVRSQLGLWLKSGWILHLAQNTKLWWCVVFLF